MAVMRTRLVKVIWEATMRDSSPLAATFGLDPGAREARTHDHGEDTLASEESELSRLLPEMGRLAGLDIGPNADLSLAELAAKALALSQYVCLHGAAHTPHTESGAVATREAGGLETDESFGLKTNGRSPALEPPGSHLSPVPGGDIFLVQDGDLSPVPGGKVPDTNADSDTRDKASNGKLRDRTGGCISPDTTHGSNIGTPEGDNNINNSNDNSIARDTQEAIARMRVRMQASYYHRRGYPSPSTDKKNTPFKEATNELLGLLSTYATGESGGSMSPESASELWALQWYGAGRARGPRNNTDSQDSADDSADASGDASADASGDASGDASADADSAFAVHSSPAKCKSSELCASLRQQPMYAQYAPHVDENLTRSWEKAQLTRAHHQVCVRMRGVHVVVRTGMCIVVRVVVCVDMHLLSCALACTCCHARWRALAAVHFRGARCRACCRALLSCTVVVRLLACTVVVHLLACTVVVCTVAHCCALLACLIGVHCHHARCCVLLWCAVVGHCCRACYRVLLSCVCETENARR
jgi:hypothetical protein